MAFISGTAAEHSAVVTGMQGSTYSVRQPAFDVRVGTTDYGGTCTCFQPYGSDEA